MMEEDDKDEKMESPTAEEEEPDNGEPESEDEKPDYSSKIRQALFAAVEGGYDDDSLEHGIDGALLSHKPLVRLFEPSNTSRKLKPGANAKELKELVLASVQCFHKGFARRFFSGIKPILQHVIQEETYIPESAFEEEDKSQVTERSTAPEEITPDPQSSEALHFLLYTTLCLQAYFDAVVEKQKASRKSNATQQSVPIVDEACEVAEILHDLLFELHCCGPDGFPAQTAILNLCESWWHANGSQREPLVPMALTLMAVKALGTDERPPQKSDIKRLLKMQDAFHVIDWADESSNSLRSLLQKIVSNPLCLKLAEGKKLLSGLFLVDAGLVDDLHQAIRIQIPQAKKPILAAFGEIYKRAWKESLDHKIPEEIQQSIEENVLQDLMFAVLHLETPRMTKALLVVLEPFHEAKKASDVEGLLYRMYGPILWRSLSAANHQVRINAAIVFGQVFPLQEPSHAQADAALHRGAEKLLALLQDTSPKVREAGSETVARILTTYWNVLATDDIRNLLNHIVLRHSSDKSSYLVRVASLQAATALLEAPQSHAVLRTLLPKLGNLIHDTNKHVRLAAVKMLLKVKATKGIKYYHVVPVDHLKARLAEEGQLCIKNTSEPKDLFPLQSDVASGLTRLMLNSYVPQGPDVSAVDQIKRTLSFLSSDPQAAAVFYANLADHLPTTAIAKLAAMLLRCLTSAVETEKKKQETKKSSIKRTHTEDSETDDESEEDDSEDESTFLTASNTGLMASLSETIASLWESIQEDLEYEENMNSQRFLVDAFSGTVLTDMLSFFEEKAAATGSEDDIIVGEDYTQEECSRVCGALLRCASFLNLKDVKGLLGHIASSLRVFSTANTDQLENNLSTKSVSNYIALLCVWGMTEDVATCLSSSLDSIIDDSHGNALDLLSPFSDMSKKRRSGRGSSKKKSNAVNESVLPKLPPKVALTVLNDVMRGSDPGNVAARERMIATTKARDALEDTLERGIVYASRLLKMASDRTQTMEDANVELVIRLCESFGRFTLHKAAFFALGDGGKIVFSEQARQMLEWTTEQVLPALMNESNGFPLQDLDLSRISFVNDSIVSMETEVNLDSTRSPGLMSPLGPPRKRGNRNATPERLDGNDAAPSKVVVSKRKDSKIIPGDSTILLVRVASFSLLQASCMVFSEWLFVGDGCGGVPILEAALKWCAVFESTVGTEGKELSRKNKMCRKQIQMQILPAFARLAVALGKYACQFGLVKQLILTGYRIGDETHENENENIEAVSSVVQQMVSTVLKSSQLVREKAIDAVLEVAYKAMADTTGNEEKENKNNTSTRSTDMSREMPSSMYEIICSDANYGMGSSVLASALTVILSHKQGCAYLAKTLVENFDFHSTTYTKVDEEERGNNTAENMVLQFEAKCLFLLAETAKNIAAVRESIRKLAGMDLANNPAGSIIQEIVDVST